MKTKLIDMSDPKAVAAATDEQFPERPVPDGEASRAASPWTSLEHKHACDRMTDGQFEASRAAASWASLLYEHACDRMNDEQFEKSRAVEPWASLEYKHACDRMTDEQFEKSLKKCATEDFSEYPWVTERPGTDRP